jgi:hypothetical protein
MSCVWLSGDRALYNSRCAEHRRNRRWSSSLRRPTIKRTSTPTIISARPNNKSYSKGFIAPPSMSSLSEIRLDETTREWPSDRLQPSQQPRGDPILLRSRSFAATIKVFDRETSKRLGMPKAGTTQDKSRALAVQDCHGRAARGRVPPAPATTR